MSQSMDDATTLSQRFENGLERRANDFERIIFKHPYISGYIYSMLCIGGAAYWFSPSPGNVTQLDIAAGQEKAVIRPLANQNLCNEYIKVKDGVAAKVVPMDFPDGSKGCEVHIAEPPAPLVP